jgi:hypothetical protein
MNISRQTKKLTQSLELEHCRVSTFNSPRNRVVANVTRQFSKQFKQPSNNAQFFVRDVKCITTRIRLVMHDACVLSFQVIDYSLGLAVAACTEQNELHYWKRDQGVISND